MNILFVVAHPDDEVLGGGALIYSMSQQGHQVDTLILNSNDTTRYAGKPTGLLDDLGRSSEILGVSSLQTASFVDSEFCNEPHRLMVETIEQAIAEHTPDVIITHHPADINMDHYFVSAATQEAMRYPQRGRYSCPPIQAMYYMEVSSSTDWHLNPSLAPFQPDTFFGFGKQALGKKLEALEVYENVIRPKPHPRSRKAIAALATLRGAQGGYPYAEAFQTAFRRGL